MKIGDKVRLIRKYDKQNLRTMGDSWLAELDIKENVIYEVEKVINSLGWILLKNTRCAGLALFVMMEHFELVQKSVGFTIDLDEE